METRVVYHNLNILGFIFESYDLIFESIFRITIFFCSINIKITEQQQQINQKTLGKGIQVELVS